jgi:Putative abortive phage resistance protein AbiGi, antitoxin
MALQIRDVLNRRGDLSTFVVHLTRTAGGVSAKERLESILAERRFRATTSMGWAAEQDDPADAAKQSQRVVCFSETPLEHIYSLVADIEGRQIQLEPYGVAFTKLTARRLGINPIWYVDMTPGQNDQWATKEAIDELKAAAIATGDFHNQPVAKLLPLFEQMGTWPQRQKEFWWEREWRHVEDVPLPLLGSLYLCPEDEIDDFVPEIPGEPAHERNRRRREFIDPRWGLEQIIAHLAGIPVQDVTPFAAP